MRNSLLFDFTVDKSTNTVFVVREFEADQSLVWDAFTKQEILDQWWAPKPWTSKTKFMDFKVSGRRFYAMVGPEGQEHWSIQDYTFINPITNFKYLDAFADKDENPNNELPSAIWDLNFNEHNGITIVKITVKHKTLAALEQIIKMGFKEGFTMGLNELEKLLHLKKSGYENNSNFSK
ncbi:MAG TPA: SRPBCC domain-containing protein [Panacibacter sp.]|nr:SRPBCC domain-containing protein [Panacibacter sp.]